MKAIFSLNKVVPFSYRCLHGWKRLRELLGEKFNSGGRLYSCQCWTDWLSQLWKQVVGHWNENQFSFFDLRFLLQVSILAANKSRSSCQAGTEANILTSSDPDILKLYFKRCKNYCFFLNEYLACFFKTMPNDNVLQYGSSSCIMLYRSDNKNKTNQIHPLYSLISHTFTDYNFWKSRVHSLPSLIGTHFFLKLVFCEISQLFNNYLSAYLKTGDFSTFFFSSVGQIN